MSGFARFLAAIGIVVNVMGVALFVNDHVWPYGALSASGLLCCLYLFTARAP